MRKSKKGLTLVEVLVAISVLTIVIFALFSTIIAMRKVVARQEEYVKIKMVCQDIDVYLEKYKNSTEPTWYEKYFGENANVGDNGESENCYLAADCTPTDDESSAAYHVSFKYVDNQIVNLSVITKSKDKVIVSGLDFPLNKEE